MTGWTYERDPAAIYRQSFATVRAEANLDRLPPALVPLALRIAHACGDVAVIDDLAWSAGAVEAGQAALNVGAPVLVDTEMVAHGIIRRFLAGSEVVCTLTDPRVPDLAKALGNTRSAAALDLWGGQQAGAVVAIGNAPTALFRLLELIAAGAPAPALVLGFAVGFVGAAESKQALAEADPCPWIVVHGRRGGSAMAAAAVNALAAPRESGG